MTSTAPSARLRRILLVDDSRAMRLIVGRCVQTADIGKHVIEEVSSAAAALALTLASPPDLILCDWHMPDMTGLELLQQLRAAGCTVPFGFVTADGEASTRLRATAAGAAFLIVKPFEPATVRAAITPFLQ